MKLIIENLIVFLIGSSYSCEKKIKNRKSHVIYTLKTILSILVYNQLKYVF